jgi:hypothetical protein
MVVEMVEVEVEMVEDKEVEVEEVPEITSNRRSRSASPRSRPRSSAHRSWVFC